MSVLVPAPAFQTLGLFQSLGWQELLIILALGVLLFGKRLPEVGRNVGKAIVEFKKGVKNVTDEIDRESDKPDEPKKSVEAPRELSDGGVDATVSQQGSEAKTQG